MPALSSFAGMASDESVIDWLLAGDAAVRWQVMRDLLGEPAETWERERARTLETGCVAELLGSRAPTASGRRDVGRPRRGRCCCSSRTGYPRTIRPRVFRSSICSIDSCRPGRTSTVRTCCKRVDLCHLGFWLGLGAHFRAEDPRLPPLGAAVFSAQRNDGGWNCAERNYRDTRHSSFHTTLNVLENLRIAATRGSSKTCVPRR